MIRSVLIYSNTCMLGDTLLVLPFLKALPMAFPGAKITYAVTSEKTLRGPLGELLKIPLNPPFSKGDVREGFDVIIDTESTGAPKAMFRKLAQVRALRSNPHQIFISAVFRWIFSDRRPARYLVKPQHFLERHMRLLEAATGRRIDPVYGVDIPQKFRELARSLVPNCPFVILAPGAGAQFKCWPLQNYIQVAKNFESQNICPVFILGPAEAEWKEQILKQIPNALFPLQATSENSVYLTIALGELAQVNIANDGGAAHLLALSDQPTIVVFRSVRVAKKWLPNGRQVYPVIVDIQNQNEK